MADSSHGNIVMFALGPFALVEGLQVRVMLSGYGSGHPQRPAQVGGTSLAEAGVAGLELATLVDGWVKACVSHQLLEVSEAVDVANLAQDSGGQGGAEAGDSGQVGARPLEQASQFLIKGGNLVVQQGQLVEEELHLQIGDRAQGTDSQGVLGQALKLASLTEAEVTSTGPAEGLC